MRIGDCRSDVCSADLRRSVLMMGSLSLALRPFGTIAICAVTLRVARVPSKLPSALTLRLAMVGMDFLLRFLGGHPRWRQKKGPRAAVTERNARANPAWG